MPNGNKKVMVQCPHCNLQREARGDVVRKAERDGVLLFCKPCRNQLRFSERDHPRKGTGIKNTPEMIGAYNSYSKAKSRVKMGKMHHPAYANLEFNFSSFQQFFDYIGPRPDGYTLDRINPLGNYEIGNVRWATHAEQTANRLPRNYWIGK